MSPILIDPTTFISTIILVGVLVVSFVLSQEIKRRKQSEIQRQMAEKALQESESRYRLVVETQSDFILHSLPDTTIVFANPSICQALGFSLTEIIGKKWSDFANPEDLQRDVFKGLSELTPESPTFIAENRDSRVDGQIGWTQWINRGIFNKIGQLVEIQSVGRDITALKQVEMALRQNEERLQLVTENMSDLVCLHQLDGQYLYVTPSCQSLLGYSPTELLGQDPYHWVHPEDQAQFRQASNWLTLTKNAVPVTYRMRKKTGDYIWLETLTKPIFDTEGKIIHLQMTSRDVSAQIKVEQQLRHDAFYDALTGLPNRHMLIERLNQIIKRVKRSPALKIAVLFLDLDHFKVINDSLGHLIGDQLLMAVAHKLNTCIREIDLAVRLGGDEFVIVLEEVSSIGDVVYIAERILRELQSPIQLHDRDIFITTSIGIVWVTSNHHQAEDLIRDADLAMYQAKSQGRGCYAIFNSTMHLQALQRLNLENDLRKALENQEFVLYYQPIVSLKTFLLQGFEALIRWEHPQRGLLTPNQFISVAEETGLIIPLGRWVFQQACQQLATWQQGISTAKNLKLSINLSAQQLQDPQLLNQLIQIIQTTGIQGENLILEITESMLIENVETTRELLAQIQLRGIQVSIDDFGKGYSSLSYLHQLSVNGLKIDRAFIHKIEQADKNYTLVDIIISLSNLLGLYTVAEGIETSQQLEWLQKRQCEFGQGFLFSKPVPSELAEKFLNYCDQRLDSLFKTQ